MEIKAGQLEGISKDLGNLVKKPLFIGDSLQIARIAKKITSEQQLFTDKHLELLQKYGNKDDSGKLLSKDVDGLTYYDISDENMVLFQKEFIDLQNTIISIDVEPYQLQYPEKLDGIRPDELFNICDIILV